MITVEQVVKVTGWPVARWNGNCYSISCQILKHKLVEGHPIFGHYYGPISPDGHWGKFAGCQFVQHGWILLSNGRIMDPTRWSFTNTEPKIYVFNNDDPEFAEYDDGGDRVRVLMRKPCPDATKEEKTLKLDLKPEAAELINCMLDGKATCKSIAPSQLIWVANAPYHQLGIFVPFIYQAIADLGLIAFIPKDYQIRARREYQIDI